MKNEKKGILKIILAFIIVASILSLSGFAFYWYEIRPAKIKRDCSWIKHHTDAVPERPSMTVEELETKGLIKECEESPKYELFTEFNCEEENKRTIEKYKSPKVAEPAKDWQVKATKEEYEFCLHDSGL